MKKMFFTLALAVSLVGTLSAQVNNNAIGLRMGYGYEISFQHYLGDANRLELDLGGNAFGTNASGYVSWGVAINGIYQWVWDLSVLSPGFNWYAGFGGALLTHSSHFGVGILGQAGIEYNFNISLQQIGIESNNNMPLQLSLDYRPGIYIIPGTDRVLRESLEGICLSARYRF